ncbi:MAG: ubiquinone/menaquinone biosynthesis C-methylase UbiE [Luteibaculaceae bacterium]|jgi:ubiquinone/menaquinone biosynthesis C-methylase UbiE
MGDIERLVPGTMEWNAFYANHIFRYKWAESFMGEATISVLDVACGVGYGTHYLANKFPKSQFTGVDISGEALEMAKKQFSAPNIQFFLDNAEELSLLPTNQRFDFIISFETFEHLKNPTKFLESIRKRLNPGGKVLISSPNADRLSDYATEEWEYHEKEYTLSEAREIFQTNGFLVKQAFGQQLNEIGALKDQIRKELNRLRSNPFIRLGLWFQKLKGRVIPSAILPEIESDFLLKKLEVNEKIVDRSSFVLMFELEGNGG